ncbi:hypothetical protein BDR06DRAFT_1010703 [Suillus hirtellus]|nr:hypothetical protein BDR06DRAFT_1010703 [Suillus hirtellus]
MPQKKWATPEQEEFLMSHLPEFCILAAKKNYKDFLKHVGIEWFQCWPEHKAMFPDFPANHIYTAEEERVIALGLDARHEQLATWFRWKINPACLHRSASARGVLKFDAVLAGGVNLKGTHTLQKLDVYSNMYYEKKVKHAADDAIQKECITNRGPKLNKHQEMTHHMYSDESEDVKAKINRKYQKLKVRAIHKLGPMLDWILKYLGYATGGWKFTVLMGGHDPDTGEVSMFNYHIGELEGSTQFNQVCKNFDAMQNSFLQFVKDAIAFESTLPQEAESDEDESPIEWDSDGSDSDKECRKSRKDFDGLYRMTPQLDRAATSSSCGDLHGSCDNNIGNIDSLGDASTALVDTSGHASSSFGFTHDGPDPIVTGNIDFSAFNSQVFLSGINDLNFDISALDSGFNAHYLDTSNTPSQLPVEPDHPHSPIPNPLGETLLPPVPSGHSDEVEENNGESKLAT